MSAPGGQDDFCEYVFNPLMRQYHAMVRLLQMLRDSQSQSCNDLECFDSTNPNGLLINASNSLLSTYGPLLFLWALFVFALFMFRPNSMRRDNKDSIKTATSINNGTLNNRNNNNDDDDDNLIN